MALSRSTSPNVEERVSAQRLGKESYKLSAVGIVVGIVISILIYIMRSNDSSY